MSGTPKSPDSPGRIARLMDYIDHRPKIFYAIALAIYTTGGAIGGVGGFYGGRIFGRNEILQQVGQAALAGEPPATDKEVDEVLRRTRALVGYLEAIESGPNDVLLSTACNPLQLSPDPDLLLDPSLAANATALAMDCPTVGQGKVSERGAKVQDGPTVTATGWKISSGGTPTATAVLAADARGFKIAASGVNTGDADNSASADCRTGIDGSLDCEVKKDGKTVRLKLAVDKGRQLIGWLADLIGKRLKTIEENGVTAAPSATGK